MTARGRTLAGVKIALVIFRGNPARGGAERYTADLAAALASRGNDVSLLASEFGQPIPGVRFIPIDCPAATRLGRYSRFIDSLQKHLATQKYDIVHAMLPVPGCDVYHPHAGLAAEAFATGHLKYTGAARSLARLANQLNRKRRRFAAVEADLLRGNPPPVVLCLSEYVKASVLRAYPDPPAESLKTLFNAVDLHKFNPEDRPESRAMIRRRFGLAESDIVGLMIAQDFARKGLAESIGAMARLKSAHAAQTQSRGSSRSGAMTGLAGPLSPPKLVVVGKPDPRIYQEQAKRLGVADQIIFAGSTDCPADFYRAGDFFLLPTRHDPCSLVVLEALAMGLPVISTKFNGACEIMQPGVHGFVLDDPGDIGAIADAIGKVLDEPSRQARRRACLSLRPALSFDSHVARLMDIYLLSGKR